ncbi:hypothetical protein H6G33_10020 [Calothrix sp. FACHB-1219]|uniref:hypothetical protein n=1 Tax=unclassified Calothrix TaxID=2619626 RepID=UPI0016839C6E|nr:MULTISPECIES: hypothetical protein [unclassified Calothrix]MBD2201683.1 hypothetical protein [Calothrix sp. FACHB-168]MBD2217369.1 hypothetical protein [Calothrix sp. FACHB-1219]
MEGKNRRLINCRWEGLVPRPEEYLEEKVEQGIISKQEAEQIEKLSSIILELEELKDKNKPE